jgi:UDP-N-acetyl-2-amino-2-deoxyglucuronate dehydrogenase
MIGTGAISHKHAQVYKKIGFEIAVCTDIFEPSGKKFAAQYGAEFVRSYEEVCRHPRVDYVDVCTFPDFRMQPIEICAQTKKHVQVQKPIATNLETARQMIETARRAGIQLGVVSQHRFDDASLFLSRAIAAGRLGKLLQADCYVKWHRTAEYYSRPIKGSWQTEGGGALINQAIHQLDILRWLAGPVREVFGVWQLGALHKIESEDVVNAVLRYANGATGVIQASTAFWPGYPERTEFHGTKGTAVITGDKLTTWDVENDEGDPAPVEREVASGASDPMAISLEPFERQFLDFADAIARGRKPRVAGEEGYQALELVDAVYRSCRAGQKVVLGAEGATH